MIGTEERARSRRQTSSPSTRGHHHVEHDEVERPLVEAGQRLAAVGGLHDLVAVLAQRVARAASGSTARRRRAGCGAVLEHVRSRYQGTRSYPAGFACSTRASTARRFVPVAARGDRGAFSLRTAPRRSATTLAPDAFRRSRAYARRSTLARRLPGAPRRATPATRRWPRSVAAQLRATGAYRSRRPRFEARDDRRQAHADHGHRARRSGSRAPRIVVVAHRDAPGPGARRAVGHRGDARARARRRGGRLRRTLTLRLDQRRQRRRRGRARPRAAIPAAPVDAVLVLGDLAGTTLRRPFVVGVVRRRRGSRRCSCSARSQAARARGGRH